MPPPTDAVTPDTDVLVVGSGFGGSVAALRLTHKGYRVTVIEAGRRFSDTDFATSPWQMGRLLWAPRLGWHGIMRVHLRRRLLALTGVGVGGGSLAYAAVHYRPDAATFQTPGWDQAVDWAEELAPHYARAEQMLGTATVPATSAGDRVLRQAADDLGVPDTFHPTRVGIHFGTPAQQTGDPYFGGQGPARSGCTLCGQCTTGCPVGAKNTLVKNYLHLAEQAGARILPMTRATALHPQPDGTWHIHTTRTPTGPFHLRGQREVLTAGQVVLAAGAWGTTELLHRSRAHLPLLSPALGTRTCTNQEVMSAATAPGFDIGPGVAITSAIRPDPTTLVQLCRVGPGTHPLAGALLPLALPFGSFGRRTALLFTMELRDSALTSHYRPRLRRVVFRPGTAGPEPTRSATADAVAHTYARHIRGRARRLWTTLFHVPFTAHLMGGCPIGTDPAHSVTDPYHRVHGYPTLHITDASVIPGNLGQNPSLTITAMAERACATWPLAATPDLRPHQGEPYRPVPQLKVLTTACQTRSSSVSAAPACSPASPPTCCLPATSPSTASPAAASSPAASSSPPSSSPPPATAQD
ncbi:GMC family oxidoreductase [Streptomyces sp. DT2A-34]|uniref:FAD-dependent oxidoreductase n=1 Tax=Streptomyces sp. DT2A-34 TaxID=3051182 RepID=UPI00265C55FA|nr:GMC family oxidoreductase [Streptomyces sp. DT2A-34]MDO0910979.1 GMC family oxidoreductase [Streptomyces sp. DT2A-34]